MSKYWPKHCCTVYDSCSFWRKGRERKKRGETGYPRRRALEAFRRFACNKGSSSKKNPCTHLRRHERDRQETARRGSIARGGERRGARQEDQAADPPAVRVRAQARQVDHDRSNSYKRLVSRRRARGNVFSSRTSRGAATQQQRLDPEVEGFSIQKGRGWGAAANTDQPFDMQATEIVAKLE